MKFGELVGLVGTLPLFRGSLLLAGDRDPADVRRQLVRWKRSGRVTQLRRDVYVLGPTWRRVEPHPFVIANELQRPSYVSLQSALAYHGMIPEGVPVTTSVTSARPGRFDTPLGRYDYRHLRPEVFFGYVRVPVFQHQHARVADPAKALLDLVYLTAAGDAAEYLESLRLENLDDLDPGVLRSHAERWKKKKIDRAVENILRLREMEGATR